MAAGARLGALVLAELAAAVAMLGKEKPLDPAPNSSQIDTLMHHSYNVTRNSLISLNNIPGTQIVISYMRK